MGVLNWLFGEDNPTQDAPVSTPKLGKNPPARLPADGILSSAMRANASVNDWNKGYSDFEAILLNSEGLVNPPVNRKNPPRKPTAYGEATFKKVMQHMDAAGNPLRKASRGDRKKLDDEWKAFLKRNTQRVSDQDAIDLIHSELAKNRSAALADAHRLHGDKLIRTGKNFTPSALGASNLSGPQVWASNSQAMEGLSPVGKYGVNTPDHEVMHQYLTNLEYPEEIRKNFYATSPQAQHDVIATLGKRLYNYNDDRNNQNPELLDWVERNAEKRLGQFYRQKGFFGPK